MTPERRRLVVQSIKDAGAPAIFVTAEKIFSETSKNGDLTTKGGTESSDFLKLESNEKIEKINLSLISHIKVEDHYCTVVYYKDNEWRHSTLYGKLKNFVNYGFVFTKR